MNIKIDIHESNADIESRLRSISEWDVPKSVKDDIKAFCKEAGAGKVKRGKQMSARTQCKYVSVLRSPLSYFNKATDKITKKDIENFDEELTKGTLVTSKGKHYADKKGIRLVLRVFLGWKFGEKKANEMTDFFDTGNTKKTPDYLKESEINKLYKACKTDEERYILAVLFDSGARAEEFINIRFEDVELPKNNANFVKITLKEEFSKTAGRVISLYWDKSTEAVTDFVRERIKTGIKSNEPLTTLTYDAIRFFIKRLGERVLEKHIHLHLFRHSSATYYASKLNRQQLCYRYGWAFSSDMPDVYISRAGMNNNELDEKFENTELGELKAKLDRQEQESKIMKEKQERLEKALLNRATFDDFMDKLITDDPDKALQTLKKIKAQTALKLQ